MNFRFTGILFAVAVVLVASLVLISVIDNDSTLASAEGSLGESLAKLGIKDRDLVTLELARTQPGEEKLVFAKVNDRWELQQPVKAKVDSEAVANVVEQIFRTKPIRYTGPLDNLAVHELDKPNFRVTVATAENQSLTVNLGRSIPGTGSPTIFATTSVLPKVAVALRQSDVSALLREPGKDGSAWQLMKWLTDYRTKKLFGLESTNASQDVTSIKMSYVGKTFEVKKLSATWTFITPEGFGEADELGDSQPRANNLPLTGVVPLINLLTGLQVASTNDILEKPADLGVYGLRDGDPNLMKVELGYRNGKSEVVRFGKVVEDQGKPVTPTKVYCQIEGDSAVFQVITEKLVGLQQTVVTPTELRNRDLFAQPRKQQMDALDLLQGSSIVRLRKLPQQGDQAARWVLVDDLGNTTDAKTSEVEALLTAMTQPRAARDVLAGDHSPAFVDAERKLLVKVWLDGMPKLEKIEAGKLPADLKLQGTPVELTFGKKDGDAIFLRKAQDGKSTEYKVPETLLTKLDRRRLDLVDPKLKSFSTSQLASLVFGRGSELYELKKSGETWTFESPAKLKGLPADATKVLALAGQLSSLFPDRVVAESPSADELNRYGLKPDGPKMKISATLAEIPPQIYLYDLGHETDDSKHVYARQSGSPFVVLIPKSTYDRFQTDDLVDSTFFISDPATVTKVKLRGWTTGGKITEIVCERQGLGWNATTPTNFKVDSVKVDLLLSSMKRVVVEGRPESLKPEFKLDVTKDAETLEITLERNNNLPPLSLIIGAKADDVKSYALSSSYGGGKVPAIIDAVGIRQNLSKPDDLSKKE